MKNIHILRFWTGGCFIKHKGTVLQKISCRSFLQYCSAALTICLGGKILLGFCFIVLLFCFPAYIQQRDTVPVYEFVAAGACQQVTWPTCSVFQPIFHSGMLFQFMNVLLQVLVNKSHDLLQEEVVVTVYNMAAVDFDLFYKNFLPYFLGTSEGLDINQKNILAANFKVEKVYKFIFSFSALNISWFAFS